MLERLIENWLINANELTYTVPFCQLLVSQGHRIVKISTQNPYEQGKDVITIGPDGVVNSYQLKGGNVNKTIWRKIRAEVEETSLLPPKHPELPKDATYRAFFVTNGEISDPVAEEIMDRNKVLNDRGDPEINIISKGTLLDEFKKIYGGFMPSTLHDFKEFLDLHASDGKANLDKNSFNRFVGRILKFDQGKKINKSKIRQEINALVLIASYALDSKYRAENHVAIIEGWVMVGAQILSVVEKYSLADKYWKEAFDLVQLAIANEHQLLLSEVKERTHFVEQGGSIPLNDRYVYRLRTLLMLGVLSAGEISKSLSDSKLPDYSLNEVTQQIIDEKIEIITEAQIPLMLAIGLYSHLFGDDPKRDMFIRVTLGLIVIRSHEGKGLPDPYHDVDEVLSWREPWNEKPEETFEFNSTALKPLIFILTFLEERQDLEQMWKGISRMNFREYVPDSGAEFLQWQSENGEQLDRLPNETESWARLKEEVAKFDTKKHLPDTLLRFPEFIPYFLLVFPHRMSATSWLHLTRLVNEARDLRS